MRTILIILLYTLCTFTIYAQNKTKIKDLENKRKAMLEKIEFTNKLIRESQTNEKQSKRKLDLIAAQVQNRKQLIETLNEEIGEVNQNINSKESTIQILNDELKKKQDRYAKSIRLMARKNKAEDKLMFILSAENLAQTYRRIRYLREYSISQHSQGKEIIDQKEKIENEKKELINIQKEKNTLLDSRKKEEAQLKKEENTQRLELQDIRNKQKGLQSELKKQKAQANTFNKQIEKLIQEEIALANKKAKEAEKKQKENTKKEDESSSTPFSKGVEKRKADTQGGYAMTGAEKVLSGSFENNKGRLPSPITGQAIITGRFGIQKNKEYNVETDNIGIDIESSAGAEARAVFDGVVSRVFVLPGYHTSVMIRHGKYLTIYANLSNVYVKQGDAVKARQSIGKVFTNTETNHTQLHFQIRRETIKLNPEEWLSR